MGVAAEGEGGDAVRARIAVFATLALLFVWSLPRAMVLRNLLMFIALLALVTLARRPVLAAALRDNRGPFLWLAALTLWLIAQAFLVSPETAWALGELKGQWGNALLAGALGVLLAVAARTGQVARGAWLTTALVAILDLAGGHRGRPIGGVRVCPRRIIAGAGSAHRRQAGNELHPEHPARRAHC